MDDLKRQLHKAETGMKLIPNHTILTHRHLKTLPSSKHVRKVMPLEEFKIPINSELLQLGVHQVM